MDSADPSLASHCQPTTRVCASAKPEKDQKKLHHPTLDAFMLSHTPFKPYLCYKGCLCTRPIVASRVNSPTRNSSSPRSTLLICSPESVASGWLIVKTRESFSPNGMGIGACRGRGDRRIPWRATQTCDDIPPSLAKHPFSPPFQLYRQHFPLPHQLQAPDVDPQALQQPRPAFNKPPKDGAQWVMDGDNTKPPSLPGYPHGLCILLHSHTSLNRNRSFLANFRLKLRKLC